ncbi:unnamed protein product [Prunus armeniaca]|nr:hypothetical protein GBA52_010415 [Prunus armeniaca]
MVVLNALVLEPPEDSLGMDAIEKPALKVIKVFVDVFSMEPSEVFIDASLLHESMLVEGKENRIPNWDLNCGMEEMQYVALAHCLDTWRMYLSHCRFLERTCVMHNHIYIMGTICANLDIYIDVMEKFNFELSYVSLRHRDLENQFGEIMVEVEQFISLASDPSASELDEDSWVSMAIDSIVRDYMFAKGAENLEAKEEPQEMVKAKEEHMENSNEEVVRVEPSDVEMSGSHQGVEPTRA